VGNRRGRVRLYQLLYMAAVIAIILILKLLIGSP